MALFFCSNEVLRFGRKRASASRGAPARGVAAAHRPATSAKDDASLVQGLRELILSTELRPGAALESCTLCERLGVNRAALYAACATLAREGLVDLADAAAPAVAAVDAGAAQRGIELCRPIEDEVFRRVIVEAPTSLVRSLGSHAGAFARAQAIGDRSAMVAARHGFHRLLFQEAGLPRLWALVRDLGADVERLVHLAAPHDPQVAALVPLLLDRLVAAAARRDEAALVSALDHHAEQTQALVSRAAEVLAAA